MLEVFLVWCDFWIGYWILMYGTVTAICIGFIILFTVACLLGKIWGSQSSPVVRELKEIKKQIEETNRILRWRRENNEL